MDFKMPQCFGCCLDGLEGDVQLSGLGICIYVWNVMGLNPVAGRVIIYPLGP